jgi:hypothetical protein
MVEKKEPIFPLVFLVAIILTGIIVLIIYLSK